MEQILSFCPIGPIHCRKKMNNGKEKAQLTSVLVLYVEGGSRKQQDHHSFSLYQDDQDLVPFH